MPPEAAPRAARPRLRLRRRGIGLPAPPPAHPAPVRARPRARRPQPRLRARDRGGTRALPRRLARDRRLALGGLSRMAVSSAARDRLRLRLRARPGAVDRAVGGLGQAGLDRQQVRRLPAPRQRGRRRRALAARPARLEPGRLQAPRSTRARTRSSTRSAAAASLHPDFGSPREYGIPYEVVGKAAKRTKVKFTAYGDESDKGKYRVPLNAPVEGGANADGDRHVIVYDKARCKLYELYRAFPQAQALGRRRRRDLGPALAPACAPRATPPPTPPGCRSSPGWSATTRSPRASIDHAIRVTFDDHPRRLDPPGLALRRLDRLGRRAADGDAPAAQVAATTSPGSAARRG